MNNSPVANPCPRCGLARATLENSCKSCGWKPEPTRTPALEQAKLSVKMLLHAARTISIASLLLITTLAAICSAACIANPGTGFIASFICAGALWRTALFVTYCKAEGRMLSIGDKLAAFLLSSLFVCLIGLASLITFGIVCFSTVYVSRDISLAVIAGVSIAILTCLVILASVPVITRTP